MNDILLNNFDTDVKLLTRRLESIILHEIKSPLMDSLIENDLTILKDKIDDYLASIHL
jgi:hypothetical protein